MGNPRSIHRNRRHILFTTTLVSAFLSSSPARSESFAIVIGVRDCCTDSPKLNLKLPYARNDAARMRDFFISRLRLNATNVLPREAEDPDEILIRRTMTTVFKAAGGGDTIYIFASAHGFASEVTDPLGSFVLPRHGTLEGGRDSLRSNFLIATLAQLIKTYDSRVVLRLDVSRQGIATKNYINDRLEEQVKSWNAAGSRPNPVLALLATRAEETSRPRSPGTWQLMGSRSKNAM